MADDKSKTLNIGIAGKVDPSLGKAIGLSEKEMARLNTAAKTMSKLMAKDTSNAYAEMDRKSTEHLKHMQAEAKERFKRIQESGREAAAKISESFKKAFEFSGIGAGLGVLGGSIGAFLGVEEFVKKSVEAQEAFETSQVKLEAALNNNAKLSKEQREEQLKSIDAIAGATRHATGQKILGGAASMASYGMTGDQIQAMAPGMANYLAVHKDVGSEQLGNMIGKVMTTGVLGRFGKELGVNKNQTKAFSTMNQVEQLHFLMVAFNQRYGGQAAAHAGTLQGQKEIAEGDITAFLRQYGDAFKQAEVIWLQFVDGLLPVIKPVLDWLTNSVHDIFVDLATYLDPIKTIVSSIFAMVSAGDLGGKVRLIFKPIEDFVNSLTKQVHNPATGDMMTVLTPLGDLVTKGVANTITWAVDSLSKAGSFLVDHFNYIKDITVAIVSMWAAERAATVMSKIGLLGKGLFGLGGAAEAAGLLGGGAILPAVTTAAISAFVVRTLLETTNKNPLAQRASDAAWKKDALTEKFEADKRRLDESVNNGQISVSEYQKQNKEIETSYQRSMQELNATTGGAAESIRQLGEATNQAMARMGFNLQSGSGPGGGFGLNSGYSGGSGDIRVESFGSYEGQTIGNHDNALQLGDYAVSPNLLGGHRTGDKFSFIDGRGVSHTGTYNDTSMKAPGVPNTNIIEGWNQPDLGRISGIHWLANGGIVNRRTRAIIGESGPEAVIPLKGKSLGHNITLNYSPTISGDDSSNLHETLRDHADHILELIQKVLSDQFARSATV
jgi:hypothetical protein